MATIVDGRTLPFDWYSNPDVLRLERERIFRSAWQYAGRADQVAEPGSFFTCDAAGVPVVVVRDKEGDAPRVPERLPPPRLARLRGRGEARDAPVPLPRVDVRPRRLAPRGAAHRARARLRQVGARARARAGRRLGAVRLRQPGHRRAAARGAPRRAAGARRGRRASTSARCASSSARPRSTRRTGRCAARTSSSATTARSPIRPSRRSSTSRWTRTCSSRAPPSRRSTGRCARRGKATSIRAGPIERGQFHFLWPNITINVMPGQPNLSIGPVVPLAAGAHRPLPRLLRRPGRRRRVDRRHARVRQPGRRRGHRARRARAERAAQRRPRARPAAAASPSA